MGRDRGCGDCLWGDPFGLAAGDAVGGRAVAGPAPEERLDVAAGELRRFVQGCQHPPTAITVLPFSDVCRVCGQIVRNR